MAEINKQSLTNRDNARIAGVQKYCMQQTSILVAGVAYTPAQVIQFYQAELDALATVAQAKSALKAAVAKATTVRSTTEAFDNAFKRCIEGAYDGELATLDAFGIVAGVRTTPTAATKAAAVVKAHESSRATPPPTVSSPSGVVASVTSAPAPAGSGVATAPKS